MLKSSEVFADLSRSASSFATRRAFMRGLGTTLVLPVASRLSGQMRSVPTYKNPLNIEIGDPYVLKAPDGQYYIYGTGGGGGIYGGGSDPRKAFPTFTSKNLVEWTSVGYTFERNPEDSWCIGAFWAPEVYHVRGKFYMFYSAQWRHNPTDEKENFKIGVAVSDSPTGPFRDIRNEPLFDPGYPAIDADVLFDDDGRMYLYYSRCCYKHPVESELAAMAKEKGWYNEIEESWIYGVELKPDFSGIIGEPVVVLRPPEEMSPGTDWENLSVTTHEANRRWTEGPCSFKKYGKYFVMYSANSVIGENYSLGYATAEHPLGPFVKAENNPVLRKNTDRGGQVSCTAHNCVAMSPDGSEMFCLFGGRTPKTGRGRVLFLTRMEVQKDGTVVVYPPDAVTPQPMPSGSSI
jgi:GH43 family beta-xylosidase